MNVGIHKDIRSEDMNMKELEKLIDDRHYRNDPVIVGMLKILKKQQKDIEILKKKNEQIINAM
jgi:hypothetical protein